jgi:hypothetical protein
VKTKNSKEAKKKIACVKTHVPSVTESKKRKSPRERSEVVPCKKRKTIKGVEKENRLLQQELEKLKSENDALSKQLIDEGKT